MNQDVTTGNSPTFSGLNLGSAGLNSSGKVSCSIINTGNGDAEIYAMNQPLMTTNSPYFSGMTVGGSLSCSDLNTGNGNNELYAMDQNVASYSLPTFSGLNFYNNNTISIPGKLNISGNVVFNGYTKMPSCTTTTLFVGNGSFIQNGSFLVNNNGSFAGQCSSSTINTGHGSFEVGQSTRTTDSLTFTGGRNLRNLRVDGKIVGDTINGPISADSIRFGTGSWLKSHEVGTFACSLFVSGSSSVASIGTAYYTVVGKTVTIRIPEITASHTSGECKISIPSKLAPVEFFTATLTVLNGGSTTNGVVFWNYDSTRLNVASSSVSWLNAGISGIYRSVITYILQ
jgi:hypothetical protein